MKRYTCPLGRRGDYPHPAPDRTAYRQGTGMFADDVYQVWPNRASMARSIRMQQKRASRPDDWHAMVPLSLGEGY